MAMAEYILERMKSYGAGSRVFVPKDFLDLGSRDSIDQALSRLTKVESIRRLGRGLYDLPEFSKIASRPVPPRLGNPKRSGPVVRPKSMSAYKREIKKKENGADR